ncbi:VWA domain-containing protein [Nitratireductor aquimarinus]|nr:DUF5801 repeats-in-toxin domain-containing protein [Nitratireductor aquimarinus]MBN8244123.1 VWA domain-containing protein [Nitratireductor aquimarinus]MBY6131657.1 VWA domain-containing protein [Nitratireductor aquimarinus]
MEENVDFTVQYTVTDGNGDSVDGTLDINVDDDTPTVTVEPNQDPTFNGLPSFEVDETRNDNTGDRYNTGESEEGINSNTDDVLGEPTILSRVQSTYTDGLAGFFNVGGSYGADGAGTLTGSFTFSGISAGSPIATNLEATDGGAISLVYVSPTQINGVDSDGDTVFTLEIVDVGGGVFQLQNTLYEAIKHDADDLFDGQEILRTQGLDDVNIQYEVTRVDSDGDPVTEAAEISLINNDFSPFVFDDDGPTVVLELTDSPTLIVDETPGTQNPDDSAPLTAIGQSLGQATILASALFADSSVYGSDGASMMVDPSFSFNIVSDDTGLTDTQSGLDVSLVDVGGVIHGVISEGTIDQETVFTLSVNGDGDVTLTQYRAVYHDANPGSVAEAHDESMTLEMLASGALELVMTITDGDGDQDSASVDLGGVIGFEDDVPVAVADTDSVAANDFTAETGNVISGAGTTSSGADTVGADDAEVVGVAKGATNVDLDNPGTVGTVIQGTYGKLTLEADGGYSYTRDAGTQGGVQDVFTYTLKDGDGDLSSTTLTISIGDAGPTVTIPAPGGDDTTVYEKGLPERSGEPAGSGESADGNGTDNDDPSETTSGTIGFTSPDGLSAVTLGGHVLTTSDQTFPDATGSLTARYSYDAVTGTGTIHYSYTLLDNTSGDGTSASFAVVVTDADNDVSPAGNLVISIIDDVPVAVADTDSVAANDFTAETGNVISGAGTTSSGADTVGADDAEVVGVAKGATNVDLDNPGTVGTVIQGTYGKLTLEADGGYSYTRDAGTQGGVQDVFTYTLKDGDGDLSSTTLTISIGDAGPTVTIPAPGGDDTTVYEKGLPERSGEPAGSGESADGNGTDNDDPSETTSGTIGFTSPDGLSAVTLGGHVLTTSDQTFPDATGSLTARYSYDAVTGTGTIHYSYTLLDNTSGDGTSASFAVVVTDADNDVSPAGNLVISIIDDVPVAVADSGGAIVEGSTLNVNAASGVLANDTEGADGATIQGVRAAGGDTSTEVSGGVTSNITGLYGTLTLQADGSYTYVSDPNSVTGASQDVFVYTLVDGDGDVSTTTLTININDSGLATPDYAVTVDEAALDMTLEGSDLVAGTVTGSLGTGSGAETDGDTAVASGGTSPYSYALQTGGNAVTAGTYGSIRLNSDGSYTYTLSKNVDDNLADGAATTINDVESFTYVATDANGNTVTGTISINIIDDVPSAVDPQHAIVGNAAGAPLVFYLDNDGNVTDNYGADGAGSLRFASSLDDHASGLTSGGQPISYHLNGDGTVLEAKIGGEGGTTVFTVTLNPASGTYTVDMDGTVDSLTTVDFQDSEYDPIGGNTAWFGFASDEADSADLLLTPIPAGSSLNTSDNLIGVGGGQSVGSGEGVRLDFVRDLTGTPNTGDYDDPGNQNHGFDQHYRVNGASVLFDAITGGGGTPQSTVRIKAFDDNDTGPTLTQVGDGTQDSVRGIAISFGSETLLVSYSAGVQTVEVGGRSFTVSFVDNTSEAGIQYEAVIGGIVSGTNVAVYTNSGYNSLEVLHESGQPFKLGEFGTSVVSTDPVDLSLPVVITDGDGDTAGGAVDITLSAPPVFIVGSNEDDTGGSTDNHAVPNPAGDIEGAITGGGGDDTIFGDPGAVTITPGQTANIVLVLDSSGSMSTSISFDGGSVSRMQALKNAVNDLLDSLGNSGAAHIRVNIVDFDSNGESLGVFDIVLNGDDNASAIAAAKAAVNGMGQGGGTNYEDALATAFSWIGSSGSKQPIANADLNKVLLVSDGEPTAWNSGTGGSTSFSNITRAINEMLGSDGTNEVQQITGAGWSIDAIGIALGNTAYEADFDGSDDYDANNDGLWWSNDTAYVLDDGSVEIAQVSAWSSQSTAIDNLVDVETSGSGSSRRFGVEGGGSNGLNVGEVLRFDFGLGTDYDGGGDYSTGGFNGTPVTGARFDFLDFGSSQQSTIEYTIHYTDGTSEVRTHSFGSDDSHNHDIDAPDGKFIEYIAFTATATESAGYIRLDHVVRPTPLEILDMVEGPGGNAQNVTTAEELSDAIGNLGGSTDLAAAGNDVIHGGAGNDLIFGDSPFTDDLAMARGLSLPAGSGWKVFQMLEVTPSQNWTRADTLDYIRNNQPELGRESGRTDGDDVIDGGAGNDIIFGQEGDDLLTGGEGADILYGGTGKNTYDLTEAVADIDTVVIDSAVLTNLNPEEIIGFGAEDVVDLTELFTVGASEDVSDYARMSGSNLEVDVDGASGAGSWETVAQFNVTPVNPVKILYDDDGTDTPDTV